MACHVGAPNVDDVPEDTMTFTIEELRRLLVAAGSAPDDVDLRGLLRAEIRWREWTDSQRRSPSKEATR